MPKPVKRRPIPSFSSDDQEREFWAKRDSSKYIDWSQAENVSLPNRLSRFAKRVIQGAHIGPGG